MKQILQLFINDYQLLLDLGKIFKDWPELKNLIFSGELCVEDGDRNPDGILIVNGWEKEIYDWPEKSCEAELWEPLSAIIRMFDDDEKIEIAFERDEFLNTLCILENQQCILKCLLNIA